MNPKHCVTSRQGTNVRLSIYGLFAKMDNSVYAHLQKLFLCALFLLNQNNTTVVLSNQLLVYINT